VTVSRAQSGARNVGFWLEYSTPDLKIKARWFPKAKNERSAEKISGEQTSE
jgi:hypothetical protein